MRCERERIGSSPAWESPAEGSQGFSARLGRRIRGLKLPLLREYPWMLAALVGASLSLPSHARATPDAAGSLSATHQDGQTFITWTDVSGSGVRYNVYRAAAPITSLSAATWIGSVSQNSSLNTRATYVEGRGQNIYYVIPGAGALTDTMGLMVYTVAASGTAYYAVTTEDSTGENQTITPGQNSLTSGIAETLDFPAPVFQQRTSGTEVRDRYVFWTPWQATPLVPAMDNRPEMAFNFVLRNVRTGAAQSLLVPLHGGVGNYLNALWKTSDPNEMQLNFDNPPPDLGPPPPQQDFSQPLNTCWFGYNSNYLTSSPLTEGVNEAYAQRRLIYLIEWVKRSFTVDANRVYVAGNSYGGVGTMSLATAAPHLFAAAWAQVPVLDFGEPEWALERGQDSNGLWVTQRFDPLWGTVEQNLPTSNDTGSYGDTYTTTGEGLGIYDRRDFVYLARNYPLVDFPVLFLWAGKRDNVAGWHNKVRYIGAAESSRHGGYIFWVDYGHGAGDNRAPFDSRFNLDNLNDYRLNQAYPAFSNLDINDDPGQGGDLIPPDYAVTGEPTGTINGYLEWEPATIVDTADRFEITLLLNALVDEFPDTYGLQGATVDVTPRRLQLFTVAPLQTFSYENRDVSSGQVVQSGTVQADSVGLLTVPGLTVSRTGNRLAIVPLQPTAVEPRPAPGGLELALPQPNPSRSGATLAFWLARPGRATLDVVDVQGRRVRRLLDGPLGAGEHKLRWDGRDDAGRLLPAGLYFERLRLEGETRVRKLVLL